MLGPALVPGGPPAILLCTAMTLGGTWTGLCIEFGVGAEGWAPDVEAGKTES